MGPVWKLGLDVDLRRIAVAIQCERGTIGAARKLSRGQLIAWVKDKVGQGQVVQTVSECCGFGYTLHEELVAAGAHSIMTTPVRLNLERRRKNDRMDARELCLRLARYLEGHRDEIKPPPPSSNPAASPRAPSAAAKASTGSTAAGAGRTSSIRASSSTPTNRFSIAPGPNFSSRNRSPKAKSIPPPSAPSPSSGNASCSSAGATASPMTKPPTSRPSNAEAHLWLPNSNSPSPRPPELHANNFIQNG